jgi:uncharacterized membrane protein
VLRWGVALAFFSGFPLSFIPDVGDYLWGGEKWTFFRYLFELTVFYLGVALIAGGFYKERDVEYYKELNDLGLKPIESGAEVAARRLLRAGLFALGFLLFFFEAQGVGFYVYDIGLMKEQVSASVALAVAGTVAGLTPLIFYKWILRKAPVERTLLLPSLLMLVGALKFAIGGVGELEDGNVLISLQRGVQFFLESAVDHAQFLLLITDHRFIGIPLAGLADFLSGDRTAMALTVVLIMAPPVYMLVHLVSRPDPMVGDMEVPAERRLKVAFFRRELVYKAMPVLVSFLVILISLHAVNVSLNPLSEPVPIPVRETDEEPDMLRIPLSDRLGDFTDGKLRKYVYYYGSKQIIFLAILKPDGTVGLALDECEICKPAEWNKAAQGYAQRGGHLVCKYCMTPIPVPTVNKPGGCNPIPVSFKVEDENIVVALADLIRVYKSARELDKKGTQL